MACELDQPALDLHRAGAADHVRREQRRRCAVVDLQQAIVDHANHAAGLALEGVPLPLQGGAAVDGQSAGDGAVVACRHHRAGDDLDRARARDLMGQGRRARIVELQRSVVDDIPRHRPVVAACPIAELEGRAGIDGGVAPVGVVAGQDQRAGPRLGQGADEGAAPIGDRHAIGDRVGTIEGQGALDRDVAGPGSLGAAGADLDRVAGQRGQHPRGGVVAGQGQGVGGRAHRARSGDGPGIGSGGIEQEIQRAVVEDVAWDAPDRIHADQGVRIDRRAAGIVVGAVQVDEVGSARQGQVAGS